MSAPNIWVLDIETRPNEVYSWGLFNQNHSITQIIRPAGILCFAAKQHGSDRVVFRSEWDDYDSMIRKLHDIYNQADWIVTYNGARFDSKWIKGAFMQAGLTPPAPYREVDLYRVVKKHAEFPSRKLDYVCGALGLDVKVETGGQALWNEVIRPSSTKAGRAARKLMRTYNINDVHITEQLFDRIRPWIDGLNMGVFVDDEEGRVCSNCGGTSLQRRGYFYTTVARYRRYRCSDCGKWLKARTLEVSAAIRST